MHSLAACTAASDAASFAMDSNVLLNRHSFGATATAVGVNAGANLFYTETLPIAFSLWSLVFNTTSSEVFKNGTSKATGTAGTKTMPSMRLGARYDDSNYLDGDVEEVIGKLLAFRCELLAF